MAIKENPSPSAHGQSTLQAPPQKTNFLLLSDYNTPTQSASTVVYKIASFALQSVCSSFGIPRLQMQCPRQELDQTTSRTLGPRKYNSSTEGRWQRPLADIYQTGSHKYTPTVADPLPPFSGSQAQEILKSPSVCPTQPLAASILIYQSEPTGGRVPRYRHSRQFGEPKLTL